MKAVKNFSFGDLVFKEGETIKTGDKKKSLDKEAIEYLLSIGNIVQGEQL